jgi:hypothetical protein
MAGVHDRRAVMRLAGVRPAISKSTRVMVELVCILCVCVLNLCGRETPV